MRLLPLVICPLFLSLGLQAGVATASLNLVEESGFNAVDVTIQPPVAPDTDTTTLSGSLLVDLDVDTDTNEVSSLNVISADVVGSQLNFISTNFLLQYNLLSSESIGVDIFTTTPPSLVDPSTGEFDAADHTFMINEGTLAGELTPFLSPTSQILVDFATDPFGSTSIGTGEISLSLLSSDLSSKTYSVELLYPVNTTTSVDVNGTAINVLVLGTVKATGTITVPLLNDFELWLQENSLPELPFETLNQFNLALGLQWALGLDAQTNPEASLPQFDAVQASSVDYTLTLPVGGSAADLTVLYAADLGQPFAALDNSSVSAGNPIPVGTTGVVEISLPDSGSGFIVLSASAP